MQSELADRGVISADISGISKTSETETNTLLRRVREKLTSPENGIWFAPTDSRFFTKEVVGNTLRGELHINRTDFPVDLSQGEFKDLVGALLADNTEKSYSQRSKLAQASVYVNTIDDIRIDDNQCLVDMQLSNLLGLPMKASEQFDLLQVFLANPKYAVKGNELKQVMQQSPNLQFWGNEERGTVTLKYPSEGIFVPQMQEIDIDALLRSGNRKELHDILRLRGVDIDLDNIHGFYLSRSIGELSMPPGYCGKIVQSPKEAHINDHRLPSIIIHPGFDGNIMFETMRTYKEEAPGDGPNYIQMNCFRTQMPPRTTTI